MRGFKLTERSIALVCAIVLVTLSVTAAWRQYDLGRQVADAPKSQSEANNDTGVDEPSQDTEPAADSSRSSESESPKASASQQEYTFTAVAGSTYTEFARQALTTHAQAKSLTLSAGQLLAAEVALTNTAGAPLLEIGQQVHVAQADVAQAFAAAGVTDHVESKPSTATQSPSGSSQAYTTVAVPGDSYVAFARQCIATYLQSQSIAFSTAQRVAAETYLTQSAGAPLLDIGQSVAVSHADVQSAVARAQALSASELSLWQPYADTIAW